MDKVKSRLESCFFAVFPNLSGDEISHAGMDSVEGWDSLATINLLTVIEEEFGTQIPPQDLERLSSFPSILDYLTQRQHAS